MIVLSQNNCFVTLLFIVHPLDFKQINFVMRGRERVALTGLYREQPGGGRLLIGQCEYILEQLPEF